MACRTYTLHDLTSIPVTGSCSPRLLSFLCCIGQISMSELGHSLSTLTGWGSIAEDKKITLLTVVEIQSNMGSKNACMIVSLVNVMCKSANGYHKQTIYLLVERIRTSTLSLMHFLPVSFASSMHALYNSKITSDIHGKPGWMLSTVDIWM